MKAITDHSRTAVFVSGLRKAYAEKVVVDDVDLSIGDGEVFALLGPNGAGKTTIVRMLSTQTPADAGTAIVMGHDLRREAAAVRGVIGVTGQFSAVDDLLTGEENLALMGRLLHLGAPERHARTSELLERELVRDGVTVLLTTQYLEEADQLADRIAMLDHGRIVAEGTPEELKRRMPGAHIRLLFADAASLDKAARELREGTRDDEELVLRVPNERGIRSLRDVLARLGDDVTVEDLSIHTPDLDDVFFAVTGKGSKEKH
jgi:ABC-2 type transport system ATP-binding protein